MESNSNTVNNTNNSSAEKTMVSDASKSILDHLAAEMDSGFMEAGKNLAELFRAVCIASIKLPEMDLHTELISLHNNEEGLTISVHRDVVDNRRDEGKDHDQGHDEGTDGYDDYEDEEEELLYDGD